VEDGGLFFILFCASFARWEVFCTVGDVLFKHAFSAKQKMKCGGGEIDNCNENGGAMLSLELMMVVRRVEG
jgi:hypothetical protein